MTRALSVHLGWLALAVAISSMACSRSARQYYETGNRYFDQKKYREAVIEYRNALRQDAKYGEARLKLADAYAQLGDRSGALQEYLRAADLLPDNVDAQLKAGTFFLLSGRYEEAKARAVAVLSKNPRHLQAQILLANATAGLKDLDGAIKEIQEAIALDPQEGQVFASLGVFQLAKGNTKEAEAAFKRAVELEPTSVNARLALANFYWASGRKSEGEQGLLEAHALEPENPVVNRALAVFYLMSNRAPEAERYLKVVADTTKDPRARLSLADYYIAMSRQADATRVLEDLARDASAYTAARSRIAAIQYAAGKTADAQKTIDEVLKRKPNDPNALLVKARFLVADRKLDEALVRAKAAVEANPRSMPAQYLLGKIYAAKNDPDEAIKAYSEVLRLNPRAVPVQLEIARLQLARGDAEMAVQFADQAVRAQPENPVTHLALARMLAARGDLALAESELRPLVDRYPESAAVAAQMGTLLMFKKDEQGARQSFERALELDPNSYEALVGLTTLDVAAKRMNAARVRIDARLARTPGDAAVLILSARAYASAGDTARAEQALLRAVDVDPSSLQAYALLGQLYFAQKKPDQALARFDQLAKRQSKPVAAETMIGMILQAEGKSSEARRHYEKALELDPHAPVAANNLAWMYADSGASLDLALQLAQTAKQGLPGQPEVDDTLGWIYYKKGHPALALGPLQRAVDSAPQNPIYRYHLGLAYLGSGDKDKAAASLGQALKLDPNFEGAAEARKALGR
jgi:putative PEP-CTERM system TPR-repeat lipoprotein